MAGHQPRFKGGDWLVVDDVSGRVIHASEARHRWDGAIVGDSNWEPRHPQEFVKGVKDDQSVPYSRPALTVSVAALGVISPVPEPGAPVAPSTLIASSIIVGQVDLIWVDNSTDESGFVIERKQTNSPIDPMRNGHLPLVGSVGPNVITFSQIGLQSGQLFDYQVSAKGSTGALSIPSNRVSVVVL